MRLTVSVQDRIGTTAISIDPNDLIERLKDEIQNRADVPVSVQRITLERTGSNIELDRWTVASYGVVEDDELSVAVVSELAEPIRILIDRQAGIDLEVSTRRYDTVESLKAIIETQIGVPKNRMRIYHEREEMQNEHTIAYYNPNCELTLLLPEDFLLSIETDMQQTINVATNLSETIGQLRIRCEAKLQRKTTNKYELKLRETWLDEGESLGFYNIVSSDKLTLHESIAVTVVACNDRFFTVEACYCDSASLLKSRIANKLQLPLSDVRLFSSGDSIQDISNNQPLGECERIIYALCPKEVIMTVNLFMGVIKRGFIVPENTLIQSILDRPEIRCYSIQGLEFGGLMLDKDKSLSECNIPIVAQLEGLCEVIVSTVHQRRLNVSLVRASEDSYRLQKLIESCENIPLGSQSLKYFDTSFEQGFSKNGMELTLWLTDDVGIELIRKGAASVKVFALQTDTVESLKLKLLADHHIETTALFFNNVELKDEQTLQECGMTGNSSFQITTDIAEIVFVTLRTKHKDDVKVSVKQIDTISTLKKRAREACNFPANIDPKDIKLVYESIELTDSQTVSECFGCSSVVVDMWVRPAVAVTFRRRYNEMVFGSRLVYMSEDYINGVYAMTNRNVVGVDRGKKSRMRPAQARKEKKLWFRIMNRDTIPITIEENEPIIIDFTVLQSHCEADSPSKLKFLHQGQLVNLKSCYSGLQISPENPIDLLFPGFIMILAKSTNRKLFRIAVNSSDTVTSIKLGISDFLKLSAEKLTIVHSSTVLEDDSKVCECGVNHGSTVEVVTPEDVLVRVNINVEKRLIVIVRKSSTMKDVKVAIEKKTGWLRQVQKLNVGGEAVTDERKVSDFGSENALLVHLSLGYLMGTQT